MKNSNDVDRAVPAKTESGGGIHRVDRVRGVIVAVGALVTSAVSILVRADIIPKQVEFIAALGVLVIVLATLSAVVPRVHGRLPSASLRYLVAAVALLVLVALQSASVKPLEGPDDQGPTPYLIGYALTEEGARAAENIGSEDLHQVAIAGGADRLDEYFGTSLFVVKVAYSLSYLAFLFCTISLIVTGVTMDERRSTGHDPAALTGASG